MTMAVVGDQHGDDDDDGGGDDNGVEYHYDDWGVDRVDLNFQTGNDIYITVPCVPHPLIPSVRPAVTAV